MTRHITGEVELPDGSEVKYGLVRARAVGVMPVDALTDAITMSVSTDLVIEDGSVSGYLAAPCEYEISVLAADGRTVLLPPFRVGVPEGSGSLTFGQLYLTANTAPDFPDPVVRVGGEILRLGTTELETDRQLRPDGEGGLVWEEDAPPTWDDLLGKPSEFPPQAHTHGISDLTGLQAALDAQAAHQTSATPHVGRVVQTSPSEESNNRIQGSAAGFPILELLRHASSTDADIIFSLLNASASNILFGLTASGRIGLGGSPSAGGEWLLRLNGGGVSIDPGNRIREQSLGTEVTFSPNGSAGLRISPSLQVNGSGSPTATVEAVSATANRVILVLRLAPAQTSNAIEVQSPDGSALYFALTPTGQIQHVGGIISVGGNPRGVNAIDLQVLRTASTQVASGAYSTICGGSNNTAAGAWGTVPGGESNVANAGSSPALAWGRYTSCLHPYSVTMGDYIASRWPGTITFGLGRMATRAGEAQGHIGASGIQTIDEAVVTLRLCAIQPQTTIKFRGEIVARRASGGSDIATWSFRVTATRDATGNVSIVSSSFVADDPGPGYSVGVTADTSSQSARFTAAGLAGHSVRFAILFTATEVFY